jgi:EF hand
MKMTKTVALVLTMLGTSILIAGAQDDNDGPPPGGGGGPDGHRHHHPQIPLVQALDANHDGIIDSNEIANASAELLTLDKNGDGILTTNEYLPSPPPGNGDFHGRHFDFSKMPLVKALDANHDGVIDANEIANASAELKTLDKNGDGQLTPDEYTGRPPHHRSDDDGNGPGGDNDGGPPNGGPPADNQNSTM